MDKNIKGINIEIGGDLTGLDKALKTADGSIKSLTTELNAINRGLKIDPGNMELLGQKSEITAKKIEETKKRLDMLNQAQENAKKQLENKEIGEEQYRALQREVFYTENALKKLETTAQDTAFRLENGGKSAKDLADEEAKMAKEAEIAEKNLKGLADEQNKLSNESKRLGENIDEASAKTSIFGDVLKANLLSNAITGGLNAINNGFRNVIHSVGDWVSEGMSTTLQFKEAQMQLTQVMRNTMDARDEDVQSIIRLAEAQEKLGVISVESQIAGAQELGTYLEKKESLEKIIPVMNDMLAQQYGVNASQESAVSIATMLGKVMNGQVGALSRYGYTFDEVQEKILKYGTEAERASVLVDVVSESVGGMNEALRETDDGRIVGLNNKIGDTQEAIGELSLGIKNQILVGILPLLQELADDLLTFMEENKENIEGFVGDFISTTQRIFYKSKEIIGIAMDKTKEFIDFVISNKDMLISLAVGIGTVITAIEVMTLAQQLLNFVMMANPIGLVVVAISGLVSALVYLYRTNETAREIIDTCWGAIKDIFALGVNLIKGTLDAFISYFNGGWGGLWQSVKNTFSNHMSLLSSIFIKTTNNILREANVFISGLNKVFNTKFPPFKLLVDKSDLDKATDEQKKSFSDFRNNIANPPAAVKGRDFSQTKNDIKDLKDETEELIDLTDKYNKKSKGGSGGGSSANKKNEALEKEIKLMEHKKKMGELTAEEEVKSLEKILKTVKMSAEEKQGIEEKLYTAKENMINNSLDTELKALEHKKKVGELTTKEEIIALESILKKTELSAKAKESIEEKLFTAKQKLIEEEKKAREEAEKKRLEQLNTIGEAMTEALKRQKREEIDIRKEAIQKQIDFIADVKYKEINASKEISEKKIKLFDEEYIAKVKCTDESLAATLTAANKEIQKRIDIIALTDKETAAKLQAAQDEIDAIERVAEEEKKAIDEKAENEKRRKLEEKIEKARDNEERESAIKELYDFEEEIAQKNRDKERKERKAELEQQKKDLLELAKKTIDTNEKEALEISKSKDKDIKKSTEELKNGKFSPEEEKQSLASLEQAYKNFEKTATKAAADLVNSGKKGQDDALKILETYYPDWKEKGVKFTDYLVAGLDKGEENVLSKATQMGKDALEAFMSAFAVDENSGGGASYSDTSPASMGYSAFTEATPQATAFSISEDSLNLSPSISPLMQEVRAFSSNISSGISSLLTDNMGVITGMAKKVGIIQPTKTETPKPTEEKPPINVYNTNNYNGVTADQVPYLADRANRKALRQLKLKLS